MTFVQPDPLPDVAPREGPCDPWITLTEARARCGVADTEIPDTAFEFGIELASYILWAATGRRYGLCQRTVRPCWQGDHSQGFQSGTARAPASYPYSPTVFTSGVVDVYPSWQGSWTCSCSLQSLLLPGPVAWLTEVRVNGVALPLTSFRIKTGCGLHARRSVLRVDGEPWPDCQDLEGDPTVVPANAGGCEAWHVTYLQGRPVPNLGQNAAGILAEQLARQFCRADGCDDQLVAGLKRVSRRGLVKEYDPSLTVDEDTGQQRTGLNLVDKWIQAVNPHKRVRQSAIVRADDTNARRLWQWVDAA